MNKLEILLPRKRRKPRLRAVDEERIANKIAEKCEQRYMNPRNPHCYGVSDAVWYQMKRTEEHRRKEERMERIFNLFYVSSCIFCLIYAVTLVLLSI